MSDAPPKLWEVKGDELIVRPHPGQARVLTSDKRFVMMVAGRQSGKCGQFVLCLADGRLVHVKDLKPGDEVFSLNQNTLKIEKTKIVALQSDGVKQAYRLRTKTGRENIVSANHPFYASDGWTCTEDLKVGELIAVPRFVPAAGQDDMDDDWIKITGYLLADGSLTSGSIGFSDSDPDVIDDLSSALPSDVSLKKNGKRDYEYRISGEVSGGRSNSVMQFVRKHEMRVLSIHKRIPDFVFTLKREKIALLLRCMFSCDGWVDNKGIGYSSSSEVMAKQIHHLLLRFGIISRLRYKSSKCGGKRFNSWSIAIKSIRDVELFAANIGFVGKSRAKLQALLAEKRRKERSFDGKDIIPNFPIDACYASLKKEKVGGHYGYRGEELRRYNLLRQSRCKNTCRKNAQEIAEAFQIGEVEANSDIYWDAVESIEPIGEEELWDVEVERNSNFIAGDIFSHNTSLGPIWLYNEIQKRGPGDYLCVTPSFPLLNLKMLPEFRRLFEDALHLGDWRESSHTLLFSEFGSKCLFGESTSEKTRVIFGSANNASSIESATALAAWCDELGQQEFGLDAWDAIRGRVSLHRGRILGTTTPYGISGWFKKRIYDAWKKGDEKLDVIQFASTMNPLFSDEEFQELKADMPDWKFDLFYKGEFTNPAGLIYSDFIQRPKEAGGHLVEPFNIPWEWPRYAGLDFGGVNTAILWIAQNPRTDEYYVYRSKKLGRQSTDEYARYFAQQSAREQIYSVCGGAPGEVQQRADWQSCGIDVQEPPVGDVESQIDRVVSLFRKYKLYVFSDQEDLIDELGSYSREVDAEGNTTEKIHNKSEYHLLDSLRYCVSGIFSPKRIEAADQMLLDYFGFANRGSYIW